MPKSLCGGRRRLSSDRQTVRNPYPPTLIKIQVWGKTVISCKTQVISRILIPDDLVKNSKAPL